MPPDTLFLSTLSYWGWGWGRIRILTLTSSDEAVEQGFDIHRHFSALVKRLRRRWGRFEYIGVKEKQGDREHLHLVFRGEYMEQALISAMWASLHKSRVVDTRLVKGVRGGARYLAKYLAKGAFNRYWTSYNWVFKEWVKWSERVKRLMGRYPSRSIIRVLARLTEEKREQVKKWLEAPFLLSTELFTELWEFSELLKKFIFEQDIGGDPFPSIKG